MTSNSSGEGQAVSSQGAPGADDGPADRPSGAIEDGVVSSTADPDAEIEHTGGAVVPPGDAEPVLPPYEGRNESTRDGTPGRGDNVVSGNTNVPKEEESAQRPKAGGDDGATVPSHTPGTGRAEDKL